MLMALLALRLLLASPIDPFAFFQPSLTIDAGDRRHLEAGQPIARVLPASDRQLALAGAVRVDADGDRLAAWIRRVEDLKRSPYVAAIGRFSNPPCLDDLRALTLDDDEIGKIRECRPGNCALKLSAAEMEVLQRAAATAGDDWKPSVQQAFRELVLRRVTEYLARGAAALEPAADRAGTASSEDRFGLLLDQSAFLTGHLPGLAEFLRRYPDAPAAGIESFVYWSKERLVSKAIISATHVTIVRGQAPEWPETLVASRQIFATHYLDASLAVTALVRADEASYLVYINRSDVDLLGGRFSGIIRWVLQRRVKDEAAAVLLGLRKRLESGPPPDAGSR
jgi:hypothetical protein